MIPKHLNQLVLTIFILSLTPLETSASYEIPKPIIRVFRPRGFEASIPHVAGLQEFIFSANQNEPLLHSSDPREVQFCKSAYDPDPAGRMTVQDRVARFRLGDKMYYDVVVKKDNEEYTLLNQVFTVAAKNIFRQPPADSEEKDEHYTPRDLYLIRFGGKTMDIHILLHINVDTDYTKSRPTTSLPPTLPTSRTTEATPDTTTDLDNCNSKVYSLVQKISSLQAEMDNLAQDHTMLYSIVDKLPDARNFKLSGKISNSNDPMTIVKFVLSEKLGLTPHITSASRKDDSIFFSVDNLVTALEILKKIDEKLVDSKSIQIINYYQRE